MLDEWRASIAVYRDRLAPRNPRACTKIICVPCLSRVAFQVRELQRFAVMKNAFLFGVIAGSAVAILGCGSVDDSSSSGADAAPSLEAAPMTMPDALPIDQVTPTSDAAKPSSDAAHDAEQPPSGAAPDAMPLPANLAMTDGMVSTGWYCGSDTSLQSHVHSWADPALDNPDNLFHVDATTRVVSVVGYCTLGCSAHTGGHDNCKAPDGAPIASKECFAGAGKYCGHTLGIEARSYPPKPKDVEGLFSCDGSSDVSLDSECACEVVPGGSDQCVPSSGGRKLYIAYGDDTTTCTPQLTDFWHCLLEHTNLSEFQLSYGTGYTLEFGAMARVPGSCGSDYQCVENAAHFPLRDLDVLLVVKAGGVGGQNDWATTVTVGASQVHIHGSFIGDATGNCNMQTAYSMHEVYEASSDPGSGDCCDGEVPYTPGGESGCLAWNSGCSIACQKWGPSTCGGDGSYGLATITCPHGAYMYQRVSPADDEYGFTKNQCLPIAVTH